MERSPDPNHPDQVRVESAENSHSPHSNERDVPLLRFSEMSPPRNGLDARNFTNENGNSPSATHAPSPGGYADEAEMAFFEDGGLVLNEMVSGRLDTAAAAVQQSWSRRRKSSLLTPRAGNSMTSVGRSAARDSSARSSSSQAAGTPRSRSPTGARRGSVVAPDFTQTSRGTTTGPRMAATVAPLNVAQSSSSRMSISENSVPGAHETRRRSTVMLNSIELFAESSPRRSSTPAASVRAAADTTEAPLAQLTDETVTQDVFGEPDSTSYLETLATSLTAAYVTVQTSHDISRVRGSYEMTEMPTRLCLRAMTIDPTVGAALRAYNEEATSITDLLFEDCTFSPTVDFAWLETLEAMSTLRFKGRQVTMLFVERALARATSLRQLTLFECAPITSVALLHAEHTPSSLSCVDIIGTEMTAQAFQELSQCPQIRRLKLLATPVRADLRLLLDSNVFELLHLVRCDNVYYSDARDGGADTGASASSSLRLHTLLIADCGSLAVPHLPWSRLEALRELSVMYQRGTRVSAFQTVLSMGKLTVLRLQQLFVDAHLINLIRHCKGLVELNLSFCRGATDMNKLWPDLPNLKCLNISFTDTETSDLRTLSACTQLREVYARGCPYLRQFHVFHELPSLTLLDVAQCTSMEASGLQGPFRCARTLTRLSFEGCATLLELSSFASLTALQSLNLAGSGVRGGESLAALAGLVCLRELDLSRCARVTTLPPLDELGQLVSVDLSGSHVRDDALHAFSSCTALDELNLNDCDSITALGPLALCPALRVLRLSNSAVNDAGLEAFTSGLHPAYVLEELDLSGCTCLRNVSCLSALRSLVELTLSGSAVDSALSFPSLVDCDALEAISLCECYQVTDASHLAALKNIRDVNLSLTGVGDDTVMAFGLCSTLETLELSGCHNVTTVIALAGLPYLQRLNVAETQVTPESMAALRECPVLWEVNVSGCQQLGDLACFKGYRALQRLSAARSGVTDTSADCAWEGNMLEELDLSFCRLLRTAPLTTMFRSLVSLRTVDLSGSGVDATALAALACGAAINGLILRDCPAVDSVAPLGGLKSLQLLDVTNTGVTDTSLGVLAGCPLLATVRLAGCRHVTNVHALGHCEALLHLDVSRTGVTDASFTEPWPEHCTLQTLTLSDCPGIAALPTIDTLMCLETLDASRSAVQDEALARIARIASLRTLTLCECRGLDDATVLSALPHLKVLDLSGSSVKFIGGGGTFWRTPSLTSVSLQRCDGLQNASALSSLPHLLTLDLSFSAIRDVTFASPWDGCGALEELDVSGCLNLQNISGVCDLPHLTRLVASRSGVTDKSLEGVGLCAKLELLDLSGCAAVTDVHHVSRLPRLQTLRLGGSAVGDGSFASTWLCPSLHMMDLSGCAELSNVQGIRGLPRLQHLDASNTALTDGSLYAMRQCQSLERINLSGCVRTMNLTSLGKLSYLRFLDVHGSGIDVTSLVSLSRCTQLEELDLADCPFLTNVFVPFEFGRLRAVRLPPLQSVIGAFLEACPDLETLSLRSCPASFPADSFATLQYLKRLDLRESELTSEFLTPLIHCTSLEELVLLNCLHLDSVAPLAGLQELRFLDLTGTPVRDDACETLLLCPSLQWLVLRECTHLSDISALAELPRLRRLDASGSTITDKSLQGLSASRSLEELDMHGCDGVNQADVLEKGMPRLRIADFSNTGLTHFPVEAFCRCSPMLRILRLNEGVDTRSCNAGGSARAERCVVELAPLGADVGVKPLNDSFSAGWHQYVGDVLAKIAAIAH